MRSSRKILAELKYAREHVTDLEREFKAATTMRTYEVEFVQKVVTYADIETYSKEEAYSIVKMRYPYRSVLSIELKEE